MVELIKVAPKGDGLSPTYHYETKFNRLYEIRRDPDGYEDEQGSRFKHWWRVQEIDPHDHTRAIGMPEWYGTLSAFKDWLAGR